VITQRHGEVAWESTHVRLAPFVITSIIKATVTPDDVYNFVSRMKQYPFAAIAVDLPYVSLTRELLEDTGIGVCTVASYPLGGMTTEVKRKQVEFAKSIGASEIDVSMNYLAIKGNNFDEVEKEARSLLDVAGNLKLIMIPQVPILTNYEKAKACEALLKAGVNTIKTASGFGWKTELEDVLYLKRLFGDDLHVEVSGGVRTPAEALAMLKAGAEKIHTSTPLSVLGLE